MQIDCRQAVAVLLGRRWGGESDGEQQDTGRWDAAAHWKILWGAHCPATGVYHDPAEKSCGQSGLNNAIMAIA
jgi:hypothetical protein